MERISIGFAAGQSLSLRVEEDAVTGLRNALTGSDLWFALDTEDGPVSVRLDTIVYLKGESSATKVGFGL
ncbi:MAG: hypothetical protein Q7T55_08195 [Solirubrobacteraceae bacterium]|nr:hypothetical protein [Solirubrobacteraceae bacterium]